MQPVDLAHEFEISRRHRARQVIHRAACDAGGFGLLRDAQRMITVDHRFALSNPALVSAPSKKSFSSVSSPIFACKLFKSTLEAAASLLSWPKNPSRAFKELGFPLGDLIGVDVELLRQFGERLLPLHSGQGHLSLEARCVVPARSLAHRLS